MTTILLLAAQIITATVTYYHGASSCPYMAEAHVNNLSYYECGATKEQALKELKKAIAEKKPWPPPRPKEKVEIKIP